MSSLKILNRSQLEKGGGSVAPFRPLPLLFLPVAGFLFKIVIHDIYIALLIILSPLVEAFYSHSRNEIVRSFEETFKKKGSRD
jgi:hypothetical protein